MRRAAPTDSTCRARRAGTARSRTPSCGRILDSEGNKSIGDGQHRTYNDDFQGSRDSRVTFTATETGTYYVEASGDRDETGTYRLAVTDVTPVPVVAAPVPVVVTGHRS